MNKSTVYEDLEIAKKLIKKEKKIDLSKYSDKSSIYRFSNEHIESYKKYLEKRRKILTVTASGDQILSSILLGTKEIDSIDISRFPKYYFELKKAAIKSLTLKEYISFFVPEIEENKHITNINEKYQNQLLRDLILKVFIENTDLIVKEDLSYMYYGINNNLSSDSKIFWDELLSLYDPVTLYQSGLFRQQNTNALYAIISSSYYNVPYLKNEDTYNSLKSRIDSCSVKHHVGNIFKEVDLFNTPYDLVNLSNIIDYSDYDKYRQLLDKFKLTDKGIILSYIFTIDDEIDSTFNDKKKYKFKKLPSQNIMIYKR